MFGTAYPYCFFHFNGQIFLAHKDNAADGDWTRVSTYWDALLTKEEGDQIDL